MLAGCLCRVSPPAFTSGSILLGVRPRRSAGGIVLVGPCCLRSFTITITGRPDRGWALPSTCSASALTAFLFRAIFPRRQGHRDRQANQSAVAERICRSSAKRSLRQNAFVYSTLPVAALAVFVLYRTSFGLTLRAVGSIQGLVDVSGRSVALYRYGAVLICSALAALGGAFLTLAHSNQFVEGISSGRGFIALAWWSLPRWSPIGAFIVSLALRGVLCAAAAIAGAAGALPPLSSSSRLCPTS